MKNGWRKAIIGEVCDVANGGTPKTGVAEYWGGPHRWVTPAEMGKRSSAYIGETERTLTDRGLANSSARPLPPFSVILSSRAPIGHLVINTQPMATNQGCKGLVPRDGLEHKFLYYYLLSAADLLNSLGTGATFKELSGGKLKEVPIPVPATAEQRRIAGILDEAFDGIAIAKANAEKNLQNARALFESHLNAIFSQRGDGWTETTLGKACDNLDSKRIPITKCDRVAGKYPYYGASGIVDYVNDYLFDEDLLLVSEDGANLLARTYPIAFSVTGKVWVNNHAHVLRFSDVASQRFVEYYLNSISLAPYVNGMAQPKLNQASLNSIPVSLPTLDERQAIVAKLDDLSGHTQRLESNYQRKLVSLDALKKSLLDQAFSGRL